MYYDLQMHDYFTIYGRNAKGVVVSGGGGHSSFSFPFCVEYLLFLPEGYFVIQSYTMH